MTVTDKTATHVSVSMTIEEAMWINNALNEAMELLDSLEFRARMGGETEEISKLLTDWGNSIFGSSGIA